MDEHEHPTAHPPAEASELERAVAAYRQALLASDPTLPPELVSGQTVAEVEASVERARAIVAHVRERLAAEAARAVPPPTTSRTPLDLSALSPREKIAAGLDR
jgi:hypothetical protein